jgi:hypothetical protein
MRLRVVLPGVVAVVCLSGCGTASDLTGAESASDRSGPTARAAESPTGPTAPTTSSTPTKAPTKAPTREPEQRPPKRLPHVAGAIDFFVSPSRNIGCLITADAVRCDIQQKSYREPTQPTSCQLDYGQALQVGLDGIGEFACVGDTVLGARKVLDYNSSTVVGDFGCTSRETGMTCYNLRTRHGFLISREIVDLF